MMKNNIYIALKLKKGKPLAILGTCIGPDIETAEAWFSSFLINHLVNNTQNHKILSRAQLSAFFGPGHNKDAGLYRVEVGSITRYDFDGHNYTLKGFKESYSLVRCAGFQSLI